jgi:hypothetical protein
VTITVEGLPDSAVLTVGGEELESPVVIARSDDSIEIVANAPGYQTLETKVIPDTDKKVELKMIARPVEPVAKKPAKTTWKPKPKKKKKQPKGWASNPFQ